MSIKVRGEGNPIMSKLQEREGRRMKYGSLWGRKKNKKLKLD